MSDVNPSKSEKGLQTRQILTIVAVILLIWFVVQNSESVQIHFWVVSARAPVFLVIVVAALLGGLVAWFARRKRT
jgi:uncharacterized integral membrane protein